MPAIPAHTSARARLSSAKRRPRRWTVPAKPSTISSTSRGFRLPASGFRYSRAMALLSTQDRATIEKHLEGLAHQVTLLFFSQTIGAPETVHITRQVVN